MTSMLLRYAFDQKPSNTRFVYAGRCGLQWLEIPRGDRCIWRTRAMSRRDKQRPRVQRI